jgi:hypothetical protein
MRTRQYLIGLIAFAGTCFVCGIGAHAATIATQGAGSAVSVVNRAATFDSLTSTNKRDLGNYQEGGLYVTTGMTSWADDMNMSARLDPFFGATAPDRAFFCVSWDNPEWTSIRTTNRAIIHGVEFVYGNGWSTGDIYGPYPWGRNDAVLIWETWRDNTNVSSGSMGDVWSLPVGTIVGFYDPSGFDELLMKAVMAPVATTNSNALALDNLHVMLTNVPPAPLIYGTDFSLDSITKVPSLTVYDTIAGCQYRLVYSETLASPTWNPVIPGGGWQPGGGTLTLTDPGAPGQPHRYYCVQVR